MSQIICKEERRYGSYVLFIVVTEQNKEIKRSKKVTLSQKQAVEPICNFPVTNEHHLHIKKESYSCNSPWRPTGVFFARYNITYT
jgi:hypothetical protein